MTRLFISGHPFIEEDTTMARPRKFRADEVMKPTHSALSATQSTDEQLSKESSADDSLTENNLTTPGASGCAEPLSPDLAADADKAGPSSGDIPTPEVSLHDPLSAPSEESDESVNKENTESSTPKDPIQILVRYTASKLSPRSEGLIFYAIGRHEISGELFLKITGNQGGGLHSKEWIELSAVDEILQSLPADKPFKSSVMKKLFKSGSANNAGFLCAILRSEGLKLLKKADGNPLLHELVADYSQRLLALSSPLAERLTEESNPISQSLN